MLTLWRADWLQDQQSPQTLEASARLQPWNAETYWLQGRYFLYVAQDFGRSIGSLLHAVELNPHDARYWLDLADAYEVQGVEADSQKALAHALQAEPTSPAIAWKAANFYLARNNHDQALPLFRKALQNNPAYTTEALDLCWRATRERQPDC